MKTAWRIVLIFFIGLTLLLTACHRKKSDTGLVRVGVIAGPEVALAKVAEQVALEKYGLHVKIVEFNDYNMPNQALEDGAIDVNIFQHYPFLLNQIRLHGYAFSPVGDTFVFPMGLYSDKVKSLAALPAKSTVVIPNDPSNEARALLLLQTAKLITLKPGAGIDATTHDVIHNPKDLRIVTADAAE